MQTPKYIYSFYCAEHTGLLAQFVYFTDILKMKTKLLLIVFLLTKLNQTTGSNVAEITPHQLTQE